MAAGSDVPTATDCPAWCGVNHQRGAEFHAHCVGEVRWRSGSVVVALTLRDDAEGVELAYHKAGEAPAIVFLRRADASRLRDSLSDALGSLAA